MSNLKVFYIQADSNNIITDVVQEPTKGYTIHYAELLPVGVHGGWFKFENGEIIEIPELNPTNVENQIKAAIDEFTMNLLIEGLL